MFFKSMWAWKYLLWPFLETQSAILSYFTEGETEAPSLFSEGDLPRCTHGQAPGVMPPSWAPEAWSALPILCPGRPIPALPGLSKVSCG